MHAPCCYLFGAGEYFAPPPDMPPGSLVIAVDGGYSFLVSHGVKPDLVVGDFDSLGVPPEDAVVITLPVQKDETDMAYALRVGFSQGYRVFHLFGGTGGRLDHTLANVQCMAGLAKQGASGFLHEREGVITALYNGCATFPEGCEGTLSVFAHSDVAKGVCETGLEYALDQATLCNTEPQGISNTFTGEPASISVASGTLMLLLPRSVYLKGTYISVPAGDRRTT